MQKEYPDQILGDRTASKLGKRVLFVLQRFGVGCVETGDYDFERLAKTMRLYAVSWGLGRAQTLVALTDGGNGLERVLRQAVSG